MCDTLDCKLVCQVHRQVIQREMTGVDSKTRLLMDRRKGLHRVRDI